jgi:hypothetical protein
MEFCDVSAMEERGPCAAWSSDYGANPWSSFLWSQSRQPLSPTTDTQVEELMTTMTGGCLCGQVRYTVTGGPMRSYVCHCRDCQHSTGSCFASGVSFPAASVNLQGELKTFDAVGGSGQTVHRNFCPNCGSWVTGSSNPDYISVLVGTLDDPTAFVPELEQFCGSAQPWVQLGGERMRFPGKRN